jgi:hypothetical protein
MFGYSAGLSAFSASLLRSRPSVALELLKIIPLGIRDTLAKESNARLRAARRGFRQGSVAVPWRRGRLKEGLKAVNRVSHVVPGPGVRKEESHGDP